MPTWAAARGCPVPAAAATTDARPVRSDPPPTCTGGIYWPMRPGWCSSSARAASTGGGTIPAPAWEITSRIPSNCRTPRPARVKRPEHPCRHGVDPVPSDRRRTCSPAVADSFVWPRSSLVRDRVRGGPSPTVVHGVTPARPVTAPLKPRSPQCAWTGSPCEMITSPVNPPGCSVAGRYCA